MFPLLYDPSKKIFVFNFIEEEDETYSIAPASGGTPTGTPYKSKINPKLIPKLIAGEDSVSLIILA